eukprot:119216-Chlamydomonas_euryale.AAC.2
MQAAQHAEVVAGSTPCRLKSIAWLALETANSRWQLVADAGKDLRGRQQLRRHAPCRLNTADNAKEPTLFRRSAPCRRPGMSAPVPSRARGGKQTGCGPPRPTPPSLSHSSKLAQSFLRRPHSCRESNC